MRNTLFLTCLTAAVSFTPAQTDLIVRSIDRTALVGDWQDLQILGNVGAAVSNLGTAASGPCTLLFFEDSNGNGTYDAGTDVVFGQAAVPAVAGGQQVVVSAALSGPVRFRDDLLFAMVDSGNAVVETDESNNVWDSGRQCGYQGQPGPLSPTLEWSWTADPTGPYPTSLNVPCTPVVADLDGDGFPEVIFQTTSDTSGNNVPTGQLRVVDGRTGTLVFSINTPAYAVTASFSPAVGDIDGDGLPEIVTGLAGASRLIAFEHDGSYKWTSDQLQGYNIANCELADLDGNGTPEIVIGRQVLDNQGHLLWTGTGGRGGAYGPSAVVVDYDLDGSLEIIAGRTIYNGTGGIERTLPGGGDGFSAVANFDADNAAEIVYVSAGVTLYDDDGSVIWGPVVIPGGGQGGAPTIADYDGDGLPEIGVAGANRYVVYEDTGAVKWQAVTRDGSSHATGSSVFDFDGDGSAEVIYRDEQYLRVFRGSDGTVLWSVPMSSCTWHEYCLVADVDGDGNAEILTGANNNCGFGTQRGVFVFGDALDQWVPTRKLWNQFNYCITNVNDDLTIPAVPASNWLFPAAQPYNSFRQNRFTGGISTAAPDLTASRIVPPCDGNPSIVARVGNGGAIFAPAGIAVNFYDGDPMGTGVLLGSVPTTTQLQPGDHEDLSLLWNGVLAGPVYVVADAAAQVSECEEANNVHSVQPCSTAASDANYGSGWPGTLGVPSIGVNGAPVLGSTRTLVIGNSSAAATFGYFVLGDVQANTPTAYGGSMLLVPTIEYPFTVPAGVGGYSFTMPCLPSFCGYTMYMQAFEFDVGASHLVAFTAGLRITYGI
ncbi:MAG: VCBS repeat-containing protein [Planctomycetes bacterium]|nr:VCBS repeat-containing protein [Planctomycetota bacterium]